MKYVRWTLTALLVGLLTAKLAGLDISWAVALSPFWVPLAVAFVASAVCWLMEQRRA